MRNSHSWIFAAAALLMALVPGCSKAPSDTIDPAKLKLFAALPDAVPLKGEVLTEEKIVLGRMLYYEPRLSKSQKISCNSCHLLDKYGVDGEATSPGHKGKRGDRNSPTTYNAAGHFVQFWDGRAANLEEQAKGPVMNPVEMAMPSEKVVVAVLKSMPEYVDAFRKAFPDDKDAVSYDNMGKAIGAFERKLITPARWDKFLKGDQAALTSQEKAGLNVFLAAGCQACHAGAYLGANMYQKLGAVKAWPDSSDTGRLHVTNSEADRMMFKVPSLRNIAKTAPYFHNGKVSTLDEAISKMAEFQLGRAMSPEDVKLLAGWLESLTGEIPAEYIKPPELPKSTSKTPKPSEAD
jgi:cytochrome c peroxidase